MQYAYVHTHPHTHTHTCTRYLSTVHAISPYACMRVWCVGLCEWLGTGEQAAGRKGSGKKKMQTHQPLHTALYCTALHCTVCTARSRCRLASPRLASHCIASFRPVKLIPTSYLYFLGGSAGQSPRRLLTLHYLYVA